MLHGSVWIVAVFGLLAVWLFVVWCCLIALMIKFIAKLFVGLIVVALVGFSW